MAAVTPKWKSIVYATAFTAFIFSGTIYGAGLKTQREYATEKKKVLEATTEEKIAMLEPRRRTLVMQKAELDNKLAKLHAKMKANEEGGNDSGDGSESGSRR